MSEKLERNSIGVVAEMLGLSRSSFFIAFRNATGCAPYQWLLARRIEQARQLLRTTDLPLAEIALECGFADQSHFPAFSLELRECRQDAGDPFS